MLHYDPDLANTRPPNYEEDERNRMIAAAARDLRQNYNTIPQHPVVSLTTLYVNGQPEGSDVEDGRCRLYDAFAEDSDGYDNDEFAENGLHWDIRLATPPPLRRQEAETVVSGKLNVKKSFKERVLSWFCCWRK